MGSIKVNGWIKALGGVGCAFAAGAAHAAVPACATVPNTATASFAINGVAAELASNIATVQVEEVLDLRLTASATAVALSPGALRAIPFTLANLGNGSEAFLLDAHVDRSGAAIEGLALDRDGNGRFDPTHDVKLDPGAPTPAITPGATLALLALVRADATPVHATLKVDARAITGNGAPGSDFAGRGDGGCDAVVGATTAAASATVSLTVGAGSDPIAIDVVKSQSVAAPNGSGDPVRGATVTYTIESRFGAGGAVRDARLADPIPDNTDYVPGSLRLDGAALSDADDNDAGRFDGAAIRVALGDIAGPAVRRVQFQVKIK